MKKLTILASFILLLSTQSTMFGMKRSKGDMLANFARQYSDVFPCLSEEKKELLHYCKEGNLEKVKHYVDALEIDCTTSYLVENEFKTLLQIALENKRESVANYLTQEKRAVTPANFCFKILKLACENNFEQVAHYLANQKNFALHKACKKGDLKTVRYLCETLHCYADTRNAKGKTPLYLALDNNHLKIVAYLIEKRNVNPNKQTKTYGISPLHLACYRGQLDLVKLLVEKYNARIDIEAADGATPVDLAEAKNHNDIFQYLITTREKQLQKLFNCCKEGNLIGVRYYIDILKYSPDIEHNGQNLLYTALSHRKENIAEYLLLEKNIDPNQLIDEKTPLDVACENSCKKTAQYLAIQKPFILHEACADGNLKTVQYLCEVLKHDANAKDEKGSTPLHEACYNGHLQIIRYLIEEKKLNPNTQTKEGFSSLHHACYNEQLEAVKLLVEKYDASINVEARDTATPTSLAAEADHLNIVLYLASIKEKQIQELFNFCREGNLENVRHHINKLQYSPKLMRNNKTLLYTALSHRKENIAKYLLFEKEVEPNHTKIMDGKTIFDLVCENDSKEIAQHLIMLNPLVLHQACKRGNLQTVIYLCEELRYPHIGYLNNMNALDLACANGHEKIVCYLIEERKYNVNKKNRCKLTPLHYACKYGKLEIMKLLIEKYNANAKVKDNQNNTLLAYVKKSTNNEELTAYLSNFFDFAKNEHREYQCNICFRCFKEGQNVFATPYCKHLIDGDCLGQLTDPENVYKCPYCRASFVKDQIKEKCFKKIPVAELPDDATEEELETIGYSKKEIRAYKIKKLRKRLEVLKKRELLDENEIFKLEEEIKKLTQQM